MTDENQPQAAPGGDSKTPLISPQAIYVKDCSFESPNGPRAPGNSQASPNVNLGLSISNSRLGEELYEAVLKLSLELKVGDRTLCLAELQQAGTFLIRNVADKDLGGVLGVLCPAQLLPYARQNALDLLHKGGFPPVPVPMAVDFNALYAQALKQRQEQLAKEAPQSEPPPSVN